jgi:phytoene dehydrogenase-like protein
MQNQRSSAFQHFHRAFRMKNVIVIGAGIAGLSVGSYLQKNGYKTEIFELHNTAGGLCTTWKRNGYTVDGCVHWLENCHPLDTSYPALDELFDMKNIKKIVYEEFCSVEENGRRLRFFGNLDRFEAELKSISPEDSNVIDEMISGAKKLSSLFIPKSGLKDMGEQEKTESILSEYNTWKTPIGEYSQKFKSSLIRKLLSLFPFAPQDPMFKFLALASMFHNKNACYPLGGAQELTDRLVRRYESLGGKIHYNSRVQTIMVEEKSAKGVQLQNGKTYRSDYVISAADGHHTICDLLEGKYVDTTIEELYLSKKYVPKCSLIYLSLGVARTFTDSFKPYVYVPLKKPLRIGDETIENVGVTIYNFEPSYAPAGKTALTMMLQGNITDFWTTLQKENIAEYKRQKERIAQQMIEELDAYFGNIKDTVEMVDVATPATYIRYTNNWNGGWWEDFMLVSFKKPNKEIEGLKNFYMCGQWVGDAGIPGAAQSGRDLAQILCQKENKKFVKITV